MAEIPSGILGPLVPTVEESLLEVQTDEALRESLIRVVESDLPGFVMRSTGLEDGAMAEHKRVSDMIGESLDTTDYIFFGSGGGFSGTLQHTRGAGPLHSDRDVDQCKGYVEDIILHTTNKGTGQVLLAEAGTDIKGALIRGGYERPQMNELERMQKEALAASVLAGQTDPAILSPELHVAQLNPGDHVIFPFTNRKGPMWHRFDTTSEVRSLIILTEFNRRLDHEARRARRAAR